MSLGSQRDIHILHVDDEPDFADLTGTFLEREDDRFTVETATSADDGLERIGDHPPDCVVSDYNMPGKDGIEFLQSVRAEYPDLPFILFTGKGSEAVASDAIAAGVTDYLQKGSGTEQYELLTNRIRNAAEARREADRAERQEQLMRLTEFAGDTGGFELDTETGELLLTDGLRRLIDFPAQADLSLTEAIDLYHPEDRTDIRRIIDRARQTGEQTHGTWRLQALDGDERIVNVTVTPATTDGDTEILRGAIHDITDQHERQQELRRNKRAMDEAPVGITLSDPSRDDNPLIYANDRFEEATGYDEDEVIGRNCRFLQGDDTRAEPVAQIREAIDAQDPVTVELRNYRKDGTEFWNQISIAPVYDDQGSVINFVGFQQDITEEKERRRELRRSERRLDALLEHSTDRISIVDADGHYTYVSPSVETLMGHDPDDLIGEDALEYIHPEDRAGKRTMIQQILDDPDGIYDAEYRYRDDDGSWRWVESRGTNRLDDPAIEGIVINSREITDRKQREQALARTHDLLSNMEQLADVGAWEYDSETEQLTLTDGTRRIHGLDAGADLTLEAAFETFHPDDRDLLEDRFDECLETGEPYEIDVRLTTPDGEQRWITARGERVTNGGSGDVVRGYIQDITDRKQMERNLRQEQNLVTGIVETSPVGIVVVSADGDLSFANDQASTIAGWPYEEAEDVSYNRSRYDIVNENGDPFDTGDTTFDRVLSHETAIHDQVVGMRRPSGERVWLSVSGAPQYNDDGELERAVFAFEDITEQRELEAELSEILGRISDGFFALDEKFRFTLVNGRGEELLEASEDELLGETPWDMYPEVEESDKIWDSFRAAIDTQESQSRELHYEPRDSWYDVTVYPSESGLSVYFRDVTDRKNRERELRELTSQYETLAENIPNGAVFLFDADLRYVRAGGAELDATYTTPGEIEGATAHDIFPEKIADELTQYYNDTLDGNSHTFTQTLGGETYRTWTVPVQIGDEDIDYGMGMSQKITAQIERRQELEREKERLEEFTSVVSHDLRSPLTVAEGRLELAQETCESPHLAQAATAIDRSQALIEDLLTLAREGDDVSKVEHVGLADVAESSWDAVETVHATLETDATRVIQADQSRLKQLLENLCRNAVKHGGDDVTVSVGPMDDGFYVADTGPGIPEDDRQEVFEAGYSTAEDGTGFGLRIVKQVADAHGWEVAVTESEHGGARFEVTGVEFTDR